MRLFKKKINWEKSFAHNELLSMFLKSYCPEDLYENKSWFFEWKNVLKESPKEAIERFIKFELLIIAPLSDILDYSFKLTELKIFAKELQIPISGKKADLINRIIEYDKKGISEKVGSGRDIFTCSGTGRRIAEEYKLFRKNERNKCEEEMLQSLSEKRFSDAVRLFILYQKNQVFPTGIDFNNAKTFEQSLIFINSVIPGILSDIDPNVLDSFRIAAGMKALWMSSISTKWLPENFVWNYRFDIDTACLMLDYSSFNKHRINEIMKDRKYYKGVQISSGSDCCNACKKMANKIFDIDHIPELPNPSCTNKLGCRCNIYPIWK